MHGENNAIVEGMINRMIRQNSMAKVEIEWLNEQIMSIGKEAGELKEKAKEEREKRLQETSAFLKKKNDLERLISFSFTWGLGAALDEKSKDAFDTCVRDIFKACQYP